MSASYERVNVMTSFGFSIRWRRQFLAHVQPTKEAIQVIDLLTGMGETWAAVNNRFPNAVLSALDFSEEMVKKAQQKNRLYFGNRVRVLQQNVLASELPGSHYDIVICAFGLKTFNEEQLTQLAIEVARILKPGGQFSFVEVSKPPGRMLQSCYKLYIGSVIPVLGRLLLGNPAEYRMLWHYTEKFVSTERVVQLFEAAGLTADFKSYCYGCATGITGYRKTDG